MTDEIANVLSAVGPRLRAARQEREVTLAQLSEATGISVSTLSRLESGQRRPTLEFMLAIAHAHQLPLDELVGAPSTADPRVHMEPYVRDGITVIPLTRDASGLQAHKHVIPGGPARKITSRVHQGYEWLYVLAGQLRVILGEHDLVLGPGEAVEFDTRLPHGFGNAGPEPVEFLSLFGKQGQKVHLRARPAKRPPTPTIPPG